MRRGLLTPSVVFALILATIVVSDCLAGGSQNKEEENIIRTAYAKMSYGDEVRIVLDALVRTGRDKLWTSSANLVDRALDSRLSFELSDFDFGKISSIADRKIGDFDGSSTWIGGDALDVTPSVYNYSVDNAPSTYVTYIKFAWRPSPYRSLSPVESWPIARALQSEQFEGKKYTDYATYTVTVTFGGKSRTYNAWTLFRLDERGKIQAYFMDAIADPTAVTFGVEHSFYPQAFVETDLRTVPFVDKWLHDNARTCSVPHSEKDNNRDDVCCDPHTGHCGVAQSSLAGHESRRVSPEQIPPHLVQASFHISSLPLHPLLQTGSSTGCAQFNIPNITFPHGLSDAQEHSSGQHTFVATVLGSCTYTDGVPSPGPCNVQCSAQSSSQIDDAGSLSGLVFVHATAKTDSSGGDFSNGGSTAVSCFGVSAGTVKSCTFPCSTSVSITAGGKGNIGATINFPPNALWNDQNQGQVNCQPKSTQPTPTPTPTPPPPAPVPPTDPCLNANVPLNQGPINQGPTGDYNSPDCSPIVIDTEAEGFHLTSAPAGVTFDITGTGHTIPIAWTDGHFHNAFLALPGPDGLVHNGKELFGNFTPQPQSAHPNGFIALAQYDKPENGGNGNGMIDEKDAVFARLRLWIDENHDGICQANELHTLPELGVYSLSLNYSESPRTDEFGNQFRYKARVNPGRQRDPRDQTPSGDPGRWTYDVFLTTH